MNGLFAFPRTPEGFINELRGAPYWKENISATTNKSSANCASVEVLFGHKAGLAFHRAFDDLDYSAVVIAGNNFD